MIPGGNHRGFSGGGYFEGDIRKGHSIAMNMNLVSFSSGIKPTAPARSVPAGSELKVHEKIATIDDSVAWSGGSGSNEAGSWTQLGNGLRAWKPGQATIDALPDELRDDEPLPVTSAQPLLNSGNPEGLLMADDVRQFSSASSAQSRNSNGQSLLAALNEGFLLA